MIEVGISIGVPPVGFPKKYYQFQNEVEKKLTSPKLKEIPVRVCFCAKELNEKTGFIRNGGAARAPRKGGTGCPKFCFDIRAGN